MLIPVHPVAVVVALLILSGAAVCRAWLRIRLEETRQSGQTARLRAVIAGTDPDKRSDVLRAFRDDGDPVCPGHDVEDESETSNEEGEPGR